MITSPTGRLYIGSTINIERRISHYKCTLGKSQRKLYNSLKKYSWENHKFEIIMTCPLEDMLKYEMLIGFGFNVLDVQNLNCKLPKFGEEYIVVSDETRLKMSNWQIGRKMSDEARLKMSNKATGRLRSEETKLKISQNNRMKKPILQFDLNGNFIKEWEYATLAYKELKINLGHITACCRNERKTAGGYKWTLKNKL